MARSTNLTAPRMVLVALGLAVTGLAITGLAITWPVGLPPLAAGERITHTVTPSDADPGIHDYNDPSYAIFDKNAGADAPLVVFLSGSGGRPRDRPLLRVVADQGYRTLDLAYDDSPSVNPVCPRSGNPDCSLHFRADRVMGDPDSQFTHTPPAETILNRLTKTLQLLERTYPDEHWGAYLAGDQPNWARIVVTGHSQGAGMAALIAKRYMVARVVLFSAPADFVGDPESTTDTQPAPWLSGPSATPPDRWYAEYHARERGSHRLKASYAMLGIPPDHVMVFNLGLAGAAAEKAEKAEEDNGSPRGGGRGGRGGNPYHGSTIKNVGYAPQWRAMFGDAPR